MIHATHTDAAAILAVLARHEAPLSIREIHEEIHPPVSLSTVRSRVKILASHREIAALGEDRFGARCYGIPDRDYT